MDSPDLITHLLSGAAFGAALTFSGVWSPTTIVDQMYFRDFRMLKVFLTASGASALVLHILSRKQFARPPSCLGLRGQYDGNIIGGAMVGIGMTLTGACPGTVLIQVATGTYPGIYSFVGGLGGGIVYTGIQSALHRSTASSCPPSTLTLHEKYHINSNLAIITYAALCSAMVAGLTHFLPETDTRVKFLPPILGGLLIGATQLASIIFRKSPVGISTAYEEQGSCFWSMFSGWKKSEDGKTKKPNFHATFFAGGVMLGAFVLTQAMPELLSTVSTQSLDISPLRAAMGGLIMVLGARLAGGCTSGHGISGMSLLATSSIVSVMSMFAGGMGLAQLMG
ncbi:hypothetical protein CC78DRAFT_537180 [Lojkania enalia]|uniref:Sulphur transport domain-containing protein n=1 Tax=Lojkania enalia TaxID=147567 RepID=A0A9P4JZI0_9PLEO|nr:hypothetical protein CC78DRAFT_537180 [Didymosphaeria enalia]